MQHDIRLSLLKAVFQVSLYAYAQLAAEVRYKPDILSCQSRVFVNGADEVNAAHRQLPNSLPSDCAYSKLQHSDLFYHAIYSDVTSNRNRAASGTFRQPPQSRSEEH